MPNRLTPAQLATVATLPHPVHPPVRYRLTGRVVAVDGPGSMIVVEDEKVRLVVDVKAAVGAGDAFVPRVKDLVMITGDLTTPTDERTHAFLTEPPLGQKSDALLVAVILSHVEDLDQTAWRQSVALVNA